MKARSSLAMKSCALTLALTALVAASPVSAQETIQAQPPTVPATAPDDTASTPPAVSAQPQPAVQTVASEPQSREVTRWYGGLTLAADATSAVLALTALAFEPMLALGFAGYLLGAPLVHLGHDNLGIAGLSLAMRVALPALAFGTGYLIEDCGDGGGDFCGFGSLLIGVPVGILAAIIVDAAALSYQTVREPVSVQPLVSVRRDALWLGFGGAL